MNLNQLGRLILKACFVLCVGASPILPARAQEDGPIAKGRVIIRTPEGQQEIEFTPGDGSGFGEALPGSVNIMVARVGPDGKLDITSSNGGDLSAILSNIQGLNMLGPGGKSVPGLTVIDPGISYLKTLLKRTDVWTEIHLTARQREELDAAEQTQQQSIKSQMGADAGKLKFEVQGKAGPEIEEQMRAQAAEMHSKMQAIADQAQKALATILKPEQLARLNELDLQYRGPLALGVTQIAQRAKLGQEQAPKENGLLQDYRKQVRAALSSGFQSASLKQGSSAPSSPGPQDEEAARVRLVKARKEIGRIRQELDVKAITVLTDEQKAQWKTMIGKPFEFHPALF